LPLGSRRAIVATDARPAALDGVRIAFRRCHFASGPPRKIRRAALLHREIFLGRRSPRIYFRHFVVVVVVIVVVTANDRSRGSTIRRGGIRRVVSVDHAISIARRRRRRGGGGVVVGKSTKIVVVPRRDIAIAIAFAIPILGFVIINPFIRGTVSAVVVLSTIVVVASAAVAVIAVIIIRGPRRINVVVVVVVVGGGGGGGGGPPLRLFGPPLLPHRLVVDDPP
jgi:hypothetical protein